MARGLLGLLILLALAAPAWAGAPSLPFTQESASEGYRIRFTDQGDHAFPVAQAIQAADALDRAGNDVPGNPKGYHDGYADLGFLGPFFTGDRVVDVWDCKDDDDTQCDNGQATVQRLRVPTSVYSALFPGSWANEMCLRRMLGHELFHKIQFAYVDEAGGSGCGPWGDAACEGQARMMQDHVYTDIDTTPHSCNSAQGQFDAYLAEPNRTLWGLSYSAALFWKYLAEQYGDVSSEPEDGADFIRTWWQNAVDDFDTPDIVALTRETIQDEGGPGLDGAFHDFTIANLAKDFDLTPLPAAQETRFSYHDSGQGFGQGDYAEIGDPGFHYPDVSPGSPWSVPVVVLEYGAAYRGATIEDCPAGSILRLRVEPLFENLLAVGAMGILVIRDDRVIDIDKKVGTTWSWARTQSQILYTRLAATFGALADTLWADYEFRCTVDFQVDFPIMSPPKPTHGGPPNSFAAVPADVEVFEPDPLLGAQPVHGLGNDSIWIDLGFPVGETRVPVLATLRTPLGYRLLYAPPSSLGAGVHPLSVTVGRAGTSTPNGVFRGPRLPDQIVLLDHSQAMAAGVGDERRSDVARGALRVLAGTAPDGTRLGLVTFAGDGTEPNEDAEERLALAALDAGQRQAFAAALDALATPAGTGAIGDGLAAAARAFGRDGVASQEAHAFLVTAGEEGEASSWPEVRDAVLASGMRVHAIGLGRDADAGLLAAIATETGGSFAFVPEEPAGTLEQRLAEALVQAVDRANGRQRFFEATRTLVAGAPVPVAVPVREGDRALTDFVLQWDRLGAGVSASLQAPDGSPVGSFERLTDRSAVLRADLAAAGSGAWTLALEARAGSPTVSVTGAGSPFDGTHLVTSVAHTTDAPAPGPAGSFDRGLPVAVQAALVDASGPVLGATGEAEVVHPDGRHETLPLVDDGSGADQTPDDGVYSARYARTTVSGSAGASGAAPDVDGSYRVKVRFPTLPAPASSTARYATTAFRVGDEPDGDADGNGLLDGWEAIHPCLAGFSPQDDGDGDGLRTGDEFEAGTDPCRSDSDGGGEHDGSELARGASPVDPRDDALPAPGWFTLVTLVNELHVPEDPAFVPEPFGHLFRVPSAPAYARVRIERREVVPGAAPTAWTVLAEPDPRTLGGAFRDRNLPDGVTFQYRMRGIGREGQESAVSRIVEATVKGDPLAPIGALRLDHGPRTDDPTARVLVDLYREQPHGTTMRVSSAGTRAPWVPYAPETAVALPTVDAPTSVAIRATLRDAAGNESLAYDGTLRVHPRGSLGSIRGRAERPGAPDDGDVLVRLAGRPEERVETSDTNGSFRLDDLVPGTYTVELLYADLLVSVADVPVGPGAETDVGTVVVAGDGDGDGVADLADNCSASPNPDQRDTSLDGYGNACDADLTDDGFVNFADLARFRGSFLGTSPDLSADLTGDDLVNFADLAVLRRLFLAPPGPSGLACAGTIPCTAP